MPLLPTYQRKEPNEEESVSLWSSVVENTHQDEEENSPPAYPPKFDQSKSKSQANGNLNDDNNDRREITYFLHNNWNDDYEAIGLLGKTKQETIEIVKRGFPSLAKYPSNRIEFYKLIEKRWVRIFDEVWQQTMYPSLLPVVVGGQIQNEISLPKCLKIKIGDKVLDVKEEENRKTSICFVISIIIVMFIVLILYFILGA
ncbi:uncharacterized protein I206_105615 [Kwoniella pini CBS 10737]|uniref:Uncharacterized protein n=1 Tax=Kwoniella pini CBS 10737 TaxID=1296096 RepID=A0A1B9I3R9_9TREE|nr:uncharacterized protein I206_03485 [Kwoniella pini CBS 10737]OCF50166.1 hypothetical protein I206_03485 [Kwoniella pini CBS 10737]